MSKVFVLLISLMAILAEAQSDPNYCYASDTIRPQLGMFSTKTSYKSVSESSVDPNVSSKCYLHQYQYTDKTSTNFKII